MRPRRPTALLTAAGLVGLIGGGVVGGLTVTTPVSWVSSATVVLLRPKAGPDPDIDNPYFGFGDNLRATADVVATALTAPATRQALARGGATARYSVGPDPDFPASPALRVRAVSPAAYLAQRTRDAVLRLLRGDLAARQARAGAPPAALITATTVTAPPPVADAGNRTTVAVSGSLGAAGATAVLAVAGLAAGRQRRDAFGGFGDLSGGRTG